MLESPLMNMCKDLGEQLKKYTYILFTGLQLCQLDIQVLQKTHKRFVILSFNLVIILTLFINNQQNLFWNKFLSKVKLQ